MVCTEKTTQQHGLWFVQRQQDRPLFVQRQQKRAELAYPGAFVSVKCAGVGEDKAQILEETVGVGVPITQQVLFDCGQIHGVLNDVKVLL